MERLRPQMIGVRVLMLLRVWAIAAAVVTLTSGCALIRRPAVPPPEEEMVEPAPMAKPAPLEKQPPLTDEQRADLIRKYKRKALEAKSDGEIRKEQESWEVVVLLDPADQEARRHLDTLGRRIALGVEKAIADAERAEADGRMDQASRHYLAALKLDPENRRARDAMSRMNLRGMLDLAAPKTSVKPNGKTAPKSAPQPAGKVQGTPVACDLELGRELVEKEKDEEALAVLRSCADGRRGGKEAWRLLRKAFVLNLERLVRTGKGDEARDMLPTALRYFPKDDGLAAIVAAAPPPEVEKPVEKAPVATDVGPEYGEGEAARELEEEPMIPAVPPESPDEMAKRAQRQRAEGDLEGALLTWEGVLEQNSHYPGAEKEIAAVRNQIARLHMEEKAVEMERAGDFETAMQEWKKIIDLEPQNQKANEAYLEVRSRLIDQHYRQGLESYKNQDLEKAIQEWERVLELDPEHDLVQGYLDKARRMREQLMRIKNQ